MQGVVGFHNKKGKKLTVPIECHITTSGVIEAQLASAMQSLELQYDADVLAFIGPIDFGIDDMLREAVEGIKERKPKLLFMLETPGGSIDVAERIVNVLRHHYTDVDFIIPNYAYSAGTILAMSGDAILMDYYSVLGPIDPQVNKQGCGWVPALGYLAKFEELIARSQSGEITQAEVAFLIERFDPAELHSFEQAREQTITLLREWLVRWKFKDWKTTETSGTAVTEQMKEDRAAEIARSLNNTEQWHSHGRGIPMKALTEILKLRIEDFGQDPDLKSKVTGYYRLLRDYLSRLAATGVVQTRENFSPL